MRRSRKPFRALGSDEGSNPSRSAHHTESRLQSAVSAIDPSLAVQPIRQFAGTSVSVSNVGSAMAVEQPELERYMDEVRDVAEALGRRLRADPNDIEEFQADGFEA